jgi:hypothetical protein
MIVQYVAVGANRTFCTAQFQFDSNMGILAAFTELIVQSHIPGIVSILPALPPILRVAGGTVDGMAARGNVLVSVSWMGCGDVCDLHNRGGVGTVTSLRVTSLKPNPMYAKSPDLQPIKDAAGAIKSTGGHHHRITNITEEISQKLLPPRSKLRVGGIIESVAAGSPGFFQWRDSVLSMDYSKSDYEEQSLESNDATVNDIVIVYPRSTHPLMLHASTSRPQHGSSTSKEGAGDAAVSRGCAVPLQFSDALQTEYPELSVNNLPQILLTDYVSPASRTAHFASIMVRVYRFPCEMTFVPID